MIEDLPPKKFFVGGARKCRAGGVSVPFDEVGHQLGITAPGPASDEPEDELVQEFHEAGVPVGFRAVA